MRTFLFLPLLAMAACQVTTDDQNDSVSLSYNEEVAEDAASDAANLAGEVASDVGNTAEKVGNKVENIDVDVRTDGNDAQANAN